MKFLYKFSLRNEQEIRNDMPARTSFVAADSIGEAVNGFVDSTSLVQSVEYVSPVTVVPSNNESSPVVDTSGPFYHIVYRDENDEYYAAVVKSDSVTSVDTAIERLARSLPFIPIVDKVTPVDNFIL